MINISSWNVGGINSPIKRKAILNHLKKTCKVDIALLQETHLLDKSHEKLKREWVKEVVFLSHKKASRGLAILFNKKLEYEIKNIVYDPLGRYIIVLMVINNELITLCNIYGPNETNGLFWENMLRILLKYIDTKLIMCGDFNLSPNFLLDRIKNILGGQKKGSVKRGKYDKKNGESYIRDTRLGGSLEV